MTCLSERFMNEVTSMTEANKNADEKVEQDDEEKAMCGIDLTGGDE